MEFLIFWLLLINLFLIIFIYKNMKSYLTTNILPFIFILYFTIFIILIPFIYIFIDPLSIHISKEKKTYALLILSLSNFIFLSLILLNIYIFKNKNFCIFKTFKLKTGNFVTFLSIMILILLFICISNKVKFGSCFYFFKLDIFSDIQDIKVGNYVLVVIVSFLIWFLLFFITLIRKITLFKIILVSTILALIFFIYAKHPSRFYTLNIIISALVFYEISTEKKLSNIAVILFSFLGIIVLNILNKIRTTAELDLLLLFKLKSFLSNFLQVDNAIVLINYVLFTKDYTYLKIFLYDLIFYSFIPNFILPFSKENTGIEYIFTLKLFGENPNPIFYSPNSTLTFTLPAMAFAELSFLGVFLHSLVYSWLFVIFLSMIKFCKNNKFVQISSIYILMMIIIGYRTSLHSILVFLLPNIMFISLLIFVMKTFKIEIRK